MAETAPPGRGFRVAGMIMTIVGAVIMIGSIVLGTVMADAGIGNTIKNAANSTVITGSGQVDLEEGSDFDLYHDIDEPIPTCEVLDPNGAAVTSTPGWPNSISIGGRTWTSFDSFYADEGGLYSVDCGSEQVLVSTPVSVGGVFAGVSGILLAIFGGLGGGALLVVGLVFYFVGRAKAKGPQQPPQPHGGQYPPGPQQYPQQPHYAQPQYPQGHQYPQPPQGQHPPGNYPPHPYDQQQPPGPHYGPPGPGA